MYTDKEAICSGRTVVPTDNMYMREIAPIAEKNDCVRHAILSFAASYILDFNRLRDLQERADLHHRTAVRLFGQEMKNLENMAPGQELPLLAAAIILAHNEVSRFALARIHNC